MKNKVTEYWDEKTGMARCVIRYVSSSDIEFFGIGIAECCSEDEPFKSQRTGNMIAEYRAEIDLIQQINKYEIKPAITALKHVYCTMKDSKQYDPFSYEAIRFKKELAHLMDEYEENKNTIKYLKDELHHYIQLKDKLHSEIKDKAKIN